MDEENCQHSNLLGKVKIIDNESEKELNSITLKKYDSDDTLVKLVITRKSFETVRLEALHLKQVVDLSFNKIKTLTRSQTETISTIRVLNLSSNHIESSTLN